VIGKLNIKDHLGRVYYPEVMWALANSYFDCCNERVVNSQTIYEVLKVLKQKFRGLGTKFNLKTLCGIPE